MDNAISEISNCNIIDNLDYGLRLTPDNVGKLSENNLSGNGKIGTYVFGGIITNTALWGKQHSPYTIDDDIIISGTSNPKLTLESGVELKFNPYSGLHISKGSLSAIGTNEQIKFTSNVIPSNWEGIYFGPDTVDSDTILDDCLIEYGGKGNNNTNLYISSASPTIKNSIIRKSCGYGIFCSDTNSFPIIENNQISDNNNYAMKVFADKIRLINNNTLSNNANSGVVVDAERITKDVTFKKEIGRFDIDYHWDILSVYGDTNNAVTLTIEPGVEVRFDELYSSSLQIGSGGSSPKKGILRAIGTDTEKIIFTANTNNPIKGYWTNIVIDYGAMDYDVNTGQGTIMENCVISYGGRNNYGIYNLLINNSSPKISKCEIKESRNDGIRIIGASKPIISDNIINKNGAYGINCDSNTSLQPIFNNNIISDNGSYGIKMGANKLCNENNNKLNNNAKLGIEVIAERISSDITLKKENTRYDVILPPLNIYYHPSMDMSVYGDSINPVTLNIEPGVEIRFANGTGLQIGSDTNKGILRAIGTDTEKIIFTANSNSPTKGFWRNIHLTSGAVDYDSTNGQGTIIENCVIEYGGGGGGNKNVNIFIDNSSKISKCEIRNSLFDGICTNFSKVLIINNNIYDNNRFGIYSFGNGLDINVAYISGNTIRNNGSYPISLNIYSMNGLKRDNIIKDNNPNMINVNGYNIDDVDESLFGHTILVKRDEEIIIKNLGLIYYISGDIIFLGNAYNSVVLNIEPGVEMKFNKNAGLYMQGWAVSVGRFWMSFILNYSHPPKLIAIGTKEKPIKFTSYLPNPTETEYWAGINFACGDLNTISELEYCIVENCGNKIGYQIGYPFYNGNDDPYYYGNPFYYYDNYDGFSRSWNVASVYLTDLNPRKWDEYYPEYHIYPGDNIDYTTGPSVSIKNSIIKNSKFNGVSCDGTSILNIENTTIENNDWYGLAITGNSPTVYNSKISNNLLGGIYCQDSNLKINYSYFVNNGNLAINNFTNNIVDAKYNWWGDIAGPFDDSDDILTRGLYNPYGKGSEVNNYVDYSEWMRPLQRNRDNMSWQREK